VTSELRFSQTRSTRRQDYDVDSPGAELSYNSIKLKAVMASRVDMSDVVPVVLCGGSGTRLWPLLYSPLVIVP